MSELPKEADRLFAVAPDAFVAERQRLVRELRDGGRGDEAETVAGLRKPAAVVLAVNRAARDRPKAARAAADAATRVRGAQVGAPDELQRAREELDGSLELLAEVALAHVAPGGKNPSEAMRRRVQELLRNAAARDETREALARGVLREEPEAAGFASMAGLPVPSKRGRRTSAGRVADTREKERRRREQELRAELTRAEKALRQAEDAENTAKRERVNAEKLVASLRSRLDRLA